MIHPTSVERKQITQPLTHRLRVQPRSEVKSTEVTKQNKCYSPQQSAQNFSEKLSRKTEF